MTQKNGRQNLPMLLGIAALVLAVLIRISEFLGGEPANLQGDLENDRPIDKITVFYWAVLFYNNAGIPLTGIILLLVLIIIAFSIYEGVNEIICCTATGLSVLALAIAVFSLFSHLLVGYEHLTSAQFDGYRYNLGLRTAMDGDNFYIIGKCDSFGIRCDCYAVSSVESLDYVDYDQTLLQTPSLEQDAKTKIIYIKTKGRTISISKIK